MPLVYSLIFFFNVNTQGQRTQGHNGVKHELVFFVSILKEFNSPRYRGQNGWVKEAWNAMAQRMNEKFVSAKFIVSQLKDREQRLKKDYNAVKLILSKSGFGWDTNLKMASTIEEKWDELPENLQRFKDKPFPYYDDLDEIYNGIVLSSYIFIFKKNDDLHEIYTMLIL